jgi:hypothetical protein
VSAVAKPSPSREAVGPGLCPVLVSLGKAAELSGMSARTIRRRLAARAFTAVRSEGRTLINWPSFKAYLDTLPAYVPGAALPCAPHARKAAPRRGRLRPSARGRRS